MMMMGPSSLRPKRMSSSSSHCCCRRRYCCWQMMMMMMTMMMLLLFVFEPQSKFCVNGFVVRQQTGAGAGGGRMMIRQTGSSFTGRGMRLVPPNQVTKTSSKRTTSSSSSSLSMNLGGGILGVGAPEVATVLLVGYFILGPTELYKLTKEVGKFIQNIRTLGTEATKSFEENMESQLDLAELKKAQMELTGAFDFSNPLSSTFTTDVAADTTTTAKSSPFAATEAQETGLRAVGAGETAAAGAAAAAATATAATATAEAPPKKKKKIKRIKRKKKIVPEGEGNIPDLDMTDAMQSAMEDQIMSSFPENKQQEEAEAAARLREERLARLERGTQDSASARAGAGAAMDDSASSSFGWPEPPAAAGAAVPEQDSFEAAEEQSRFAAQLSGQWNDQIMAMSSSSSTTAEGEGEPVLAKIMQRLAILEEEKNAANARLEEEFRLRADLEEKFYQEKKQVLREAAAEAQAEAYSTTTAASSSSSSSQTKDNENDIKVSDKDNDNENDKDKDKDKDNTKETAAAAPTVTAAATTTSAEKISTTPAEEAKTLLEEKEKQSTK